MRPPVRHLNVEAIEQHGFVRRALTTRIIAFPLCAHTQQSLCPPSYSETQAAVSYEALTAKSSFGELSKLFQLVCHTSQDDSLSRHDFVESTLLTRITSAVSLMSAFAPRCRLCGFHFSNRARAFSALNPGNFRCQSSPTDTQDG